MEELEEEQQHLDDDVRGVRRRVRRADRPARLPQGIDDFANEALEADAARAHPRLHRGERAAVLRPRRRAPTARRCTSAATPSGARTTSCSSVNWRAPAAEPFYAATAREPRGRQAAPAAGHRGPHGARLRRRAARPGGRRPPDRRDRRGHHAPARGRDAPDHLDDHARPVRADQPRGRRRARDPGRARARARPRSACTAPRGCCTPNPELDARRACWSSARTRPSSATSSRCCRRSARAASSSGRSAR